MRGVPLMKAMPTGASRYARSNKLVTKIGKLHDAELQEDERNIGGAGPDVAPYLWFPPGRRDQQG